MPTDMTGHAPRPPLHEHVGCELLLGSQCNLKCDYCVAGELRRSRMDWRTARAAVDLFTRLAMGAKTAEFTFTGGEPTLEGRLLQRLVGYIEEHVGRAGMRPLFTLKTNGLRLSPSLLRLVSDHKITVVLSIDGNEATHDRHRKRASRKGSHGAVLRSLETCLQAGIPCVASLTVHPDCAGQVADNVRYLHELGVTEVHLGPTYGTVDWKPKDVAVMAAQLSEVAKYVRDARKRGSRLDVSPINEGSSHTDGRMRDAWGCGAVSSQLAVLPDGRVTGCSSLAMLVERMPWLCLGNVHEGLDDAACARLQRLARAGPDERPKCGQCDAAANCSGGCLAINLSTSRRPLRPPRLYCELIRVVPQALKVAWKD